jgi:hypothetical protein
MATTLYTTGTIDFTNGSAALVGHSAFFLSLIAGDPILAPDGHWYEVSPVDDNNATLDRTYTGTTALASVGGTGWTIFRSSLARDSVRTASKQLGEITTLYRNILNLTGPDQQVRLSKSTTGDRAGLLLQKAGVDLFEAGSFQDDDFSLRYLLASTWTKAIGISSTTGAATIYSQLLLGGVVTAPIITATTDDLAPAGIAQANILRVSTNAARTLTGIAGGANGRVLALMNVGAFELDLEDEGGTSAAANRFTAPGNIVVPAGTSALLIYDGAVSRWRAISGSATGSGSPGTKGWSPILAYVTNGAGGQVAQIADWTGGEGTKPAVGSYVGPTGLVSTAAAAVSVVGPKGDQVQFRMSGAMLQWSYVGTIAWTDLYSLSTFTGPQGPTGTAATIAVGTVTTGAPGSAAAVTNSGTSGAATLNFSIPQGATGAQGNTGATGSGFRASSATSLLVATGSTSLTVAAGLAYSVGARVRASSNANGANYMEGLITTYAGTTLTINVIRIGGSGTFADWNLNAAGDPGAGDMLSTNNLSELPNKVAAIDNLTSRGANIAASATLNLETATGYLVDITGSATVTAITLGDGHRRWTRYTGAVTFQLVTGLYPPMGISSFTTFPGDLIEWVTFGSLVRAVSYVPADRTTANKSLGIPTIMRSYIAGLTLSTAGSSATFGVAAGVAADSTNSDIMALASAFTKTMGAWAVGTGNGAWDGGGASPTANVGWYHVFLIKRPDTGLVDVLLSPNPTAPNLPANYTLFRRIGSMKTNGSFQWVKFIQNGDEFLWDVPVADASALAITNTVSALTLSVPTGVVVNALFQADYTSSSIAQAIALIYSPASAAQAAGTPPGSWSLTNPVISVYCSSPFNIRTNTSAQINAIAGQASGNSLYIITAGWIDRRGRDA